MCREQCNRLLTESALCSRLVCAAAAAQLKCTDTDENSVGQMFEAHKSEKEICFVCKGPVGFDFWGLEMKVVAIIFCICGVGNGKSL